MTQRSLSSAEVSRGRETCVIICIYVSQTFAKFSIYQKARFQYIGKLSYRDLLNENYLFNAKSQHFGAWLLCIESFFNICSPPSGYQVPFGAINRHSTQDLCCTDFY